ncbi:hypothetical protein ACFV9E_35250 [Streptomyces sp. NPDC059835]|uniref:hypothetical protein n=1 Tax=Streptomyces sp. NPDC059835 TaxID=3346967 RepID=UPI0036679474
MRVTSEASQLNTEPGETDGQVAVGELGERPGVVVEPAGGSSRGIGRGDGQLCLQA